MERPHPEPVLAPLIEVLDTATDGNPRALVVAARNRQQALTLSRRAATHAEARGFVAICVDAYRRLGADSIEELSDRTLLLLATFGADSGLATAALAQAAARSPRPHVLVTFSTGLEKWRPGVVREARATYGTQSRALTPPAPDVVRHVTRGSRAGDFERAGRHAAAERLLRDVAAALARREAWEPAARALLRLARLLIERGRPGDADPVCEEAASLGERIASGTIEAEARVWQAVARTDNGRLTDAESLCAAVIAGGALSPSGLQWARAVLARIYLWQARVVECGRLAWQDIDVSADCDAAQRAMTIATRTRILIASGELFEAGRTARMLVERAQAPGDTVAGVIAAVSRLRLHAACGDVDAAERQLDELLDTARRAHLPLRAARARLIWHDLLIRAGEHARAARAREHLARVCRVAPPLLRRAIEERLARSHGAGSHQSASLEPGRACAAATRVSACAYALLRLTQEEQGEADALRRILDWLQSELQPVRLDVLSSDAGPATVTCSVGSGLPSRIGVRVLETGITIRDRIQGGTEIGMPIRQGSRLVAALVARWPLDREPPALAVELLELATHVAAPPIDGMLRSRRADANASADIPELLGISAAMTDVRRAVRRAATAPFAVLIEGESGSGKELVARAIHQLGPRRERRFCDVNCAALPDDLLESELFGHARGSFTGAVTDRVGLFEDADGGTLFLDEIPDLSARGQAKLLRAIQQQEIRRVGESFSRPVDVRIVAAANREMRREAEERRFRQDLLYRLDVIRIRIPPLRERPDDVPVLAEAFWRVVSARMGTAATLTHGVIAALARYHWPGNVRELQNVISALAVAAPARGRVRESLLPVAITGAAAVTSPRLDEARLQFERRWIEAALARAAGSRTRAAAELGLSRQGLLKTLARLGVACNSTGEQEE